MLARLQSGGASSGGARPVDVMASKPAAATPPEAEDINVDRSTYETVTTIEALDRWIAEAIAEAASPSIPRPTASTASSPAWWHQPGDGAQQGLLHPRRPFGRTFIPMRPINCGWTKCWAAEAVARRPSGAEIAHNLKYDWVMFAKHDIDVAPYDDTMVMSFDLDAGRSGHGLDELAKTHFNHECIPFKQLCGVGSKQITFDKCRSGRPPNMPPRTPTSAFASGSG
jgi:DNA polymerase-1